MVIEGVGVMAKKDNTKDVDRILKCILREYWSIYHRQMGHMGKATKLEQATYLGHTARWVARKLNVTGLKCIGRIEQILEALLYQQWVEDAAAKQKRDKV